MYLLQTRRRGGGTLSGSLDLLWRVGVRPLLARQYLSGPLVSRKPLRFLAPR